MSAKRDLNQKAFDIVRQATGEAEPEPPDTRNPAAVELGRRGGLKGGKARAEKMTAEERSEAARKAASVRWGGHGALTDGFVAGSMTDASNQGEDVEDVTRGTCIGRGASIKCALKFRPGHTEQAGRVAIQPKRPIVGPEDAL